SRKSPNGKRSPPPAPNARRSAASSTPSTWPNRRFSCSLTKHAWSPARRSASMPASPSPAERRLMDFTQAKTAQTNGITMEYFEEGEGTPVLLLHGFPEHPFSWRNQVPAVVEAGFRVIVPSQRG